MGKRSSIRGHGGRQSSSIITTPRTNQMPMDRNLSISEMQAFDSFINIPEDQLAIDPNDEIALLNEDLELGYIHMNTPGIRGQTPILGIDMGQSDKNINDSHSAHSTHHLPPQPRKKSLYRHQVELETPKTDDINAVLLEFISPPSHENLSLYGVWHNLREDQCRKKHFSELLKRVAMSPFSLHFQPSFEDGFRHYLHRYSVKRIRYAMIIGFLFLLAKYLYGFFSESEGAPPTPNLTQNSTQNTQTQNLTESKGDNLYKHKELVEILHFIVVLPTLLVVVCLTAYEKLNTYSEVYTGVAFVVVTGVMVTEKILEKMRGPILSLFVMYIPLFGITRLRYSTSCILALVMFAEYMIPVLVLGTTDERDKTLFHGMNYLAVIVGGAISHYRQEVLRRQNYIFHMPFVGQFDPKHLYSTIKLPKFKKKNLLVRPSLRFKDPRVEEAFYRYWYLLDPHPFEHPNAGPLHANVYRSIRFAIAGAILGQLLLGLQDLEYLHGEGRYNSYFYVAIGLRFALTVPLYVISGIVIFCLGRKYYAGWLLEANKHNRGGVVVLRKSHESKSLKKPSFNVEDSATFHASDGILQDEHDYVDEEKSFLPQQKNYVRVMQYVSSITVFTHASAMGALLVIVGYYASNQNSGTAPAYYLGFLNAILFPHRSGFRVRFIYASWTTLFAVLAVSIASLIKVPRDQADEYTSYAVLVLVLGMMISYEEESLRRAFFVRKAVRTIEFRIWYRGLLRLEGWFRRIIVSQRLSKGAFPDGHKNKKPRHIVTQANSQMVQASRYGMYLESAQVVLGTIVELMK